MNSKRNSNLLEMELKLILIDLKWSRLLWGSSGEGSGSVMEVVEWTGVEERRTNGACLLLGKVEKGWNGGEVGEKCVAGISGLNATVHAILAGKTMVLLGLWGFDIVSPWVVKGLTRSKFIQKAMALNLLHQTKDSATIILFLKTAAGVAVGIVMLKMVPETPLQFGVAERLSQTFRTESTRLRLHILEGEWRGNDTSLAYLKVFGCDSFVKVKDVFGEAIKCTFIRSGSDEMSATDLSSLTKPIQRSQVVLVDILENLVEKDNIVLEHELSSKITQSPEESSDTSEGSKNSRRFEDNGRLDGEYSENRASSMQRGSKTPQSYSETLSSKESVQWKKAINEEMVRKEQDGSKRYKARLVVKGFQQKRRVDYNEIFSPVVKMTAIMLVLSSVDARAFLYGSLE
nr:hypothetical protein [Tanacetum cinerariifolium]